VNLPNLPEQWVYTPVRGKKPYINQWQSNPVPITDIKETLKNGIANGIATGYGVLLGAISGGIVAVDIDGISALTKQQELGELPKTVSLTSGRDGRSCHFYQIPKDFWECLKGKTSINTGDKEALEMRFTGHQQLLPPSIHPDTQKPYIWINSPDSCSVAIAPDWVIQALAIPEPEPIKRNPTVSNNLDEIPLINCLSKEHRSLIESGMSEGGRDNAGASLARDLIGTAEHLSAIGQRYSGDPYDLLSDYCSRCNPPLSAKDLERIYKSAQRANPTPCLSPDKIETCINSYFRRTQPKQVSKVVQLRQKQNNQEYQEPIPEGDYEEPRGKVPAFTRILKSLKPILEGKLKWNLLSQEIEYLGKGIDIDDFRRELMRQHDGKISLSPRDEYLDVMISLAKDCQYHPITQYLKGAHGKYQDQVSTIGDRSQIIIDLVDKGLGVPFSQMYGLFVRRWLVSSVARAFKSGCEAHEVLVLQGGQGTGKTSFAKALCENEDWFTSSLESIGTKQSFMVMRGKWIVEMPELERFTTTKASDGQLKNFITTNEDCYIPPYGRSPVTIKRNSVFIGTVNRVDFLKDPTGSRRFWIIPNVKVDRDWVIENRDLIWAAAVAEYEYEPQMNADDKDFLTKNLAEYNSGFEAESAWEEVICDYLQGRSLATSKEIFQNALKFDISKITPANQAEISNIMHKLKWHKTNKRQEGKQYRCWVSPDE
jgi:predicted P-loop ATPase